MRDEFENLGTEIIKLVITSTGGLRWPSPFETKKYNIHHEDMCHENVENWREIADGERELIRRIKSEHPETERGVVINYFDDFRRASYLGLDEDFELRIEYQDGLFQPAERGLKIETAIFDYERELYKKVLKGEWEETKQ
jgi:hypothetical protein